MFDVRRSLIGGYALGLMLAGSRVAAQPLAVETFASVGSSSSAGVGVWSSGAHVVGFRCSAAWLHDATGDGALIQGGVVLSSPPTGGPAIRSFIALEAGGASLREGVSYPFLRPAIGIIGRPGAPWRYVVEAGVSLSHRVQSQWSLLGGIIFARPGRSRKSFPQARETPSSVRLFE